MNTGKQFKHTRMALEILRESETLRFRLAVSIRSGSSPDLLVGRLESFFRLEKKTPFHPARNSWLKVDVRQVS